MRLVRLNEVKYVDSEDDIKALLNKGFIVLSDEGTDANSDIDYKKLKKDELAALATEKGLTVQTGATNESLIKALESVGGHE